MKGVNISNISNNKEWFEIYHDIDFEKETELPISNTLLGDHDLVIIEEPSIRSNYSSMSLLMPHENNIILTDHISNQNTDLEPSINLNIIKNTGSCGCSNSRESFSTNIRHDEPLITDRNINLNTNNKKAINQWNLSTKVYVGSITVIGLYVLFRSMQKSI
jgi:hypothetical protein